MLNSVHNFIHMLQVLLVVIGMTYALPQWYLADTPEVQEAKQQFAAAYNAAAQASAAPYPIPAGVEDPANYSPAAEAYVHVDIPAEPYIHKEVDALPYLHIEPTSDVAPAQPAGPAYAPAQPAGPVYNLNLRFPEPAGYQPVAPAYHPGTCYNWRGDGGPCRKVF